MIRRIGIDFGTSTTVLQVKNYESDGVTPIGDRIDTKDVKFGKQSYCDTYVKQKQDRWYCGPESQKNIPDAKLYVNFKMQLESPDAEIAAEAREATLHFFQYLYKTYAEQRDNGQFGEKAEREETLVSYPVKWRQETAEFLLQTAAQAGFSNIRHMNEARAAISAVLVQSVQQMVRQEKDELNILLCDMGAGTCDLVLCRYKAADGGELEVLTCWPRGEGTLTFGGREIDARLQEYIVTIMEKNGLPVKRLKSSLNEFRIWKELEVSPMLAEGFAVESCDIIENAANGDCVDYPPMTREIFEILTQTQMEDFICLVNGAMQSCDEPIPQIDLAILVGGNSQWYFIGDLLGGKRVGDCVVHMPISRDQIICPPNPQMTVAMGLVLSDLPMHVTNEKAIEKAAAPDRPEEPIKPNMTANNPKEKEPCLNDMVLSLEGIDVLRDFLVKMGNDKRYTSSNTQIITGSQTVLPNDNQSICGRTLQGMNFLDAIEVYYAHDASVFENGRIGLIICDKGIGGRTILDRTRFVSWYEFVHDKWERAGSTLKHNDDEIAVISMFGKTSAQDSLAVDKLLELRTLLKPYLIPKGLSEEDARQAKVCDIVREAMKTLQWGYHEDIASVNYIENSLSLIQAINMTNFIEKRGIDKKLEVYVWIDLSLSKVGLGDGILINALGIYFKDTFQKTQFTSWKQVAIGGKLAKNGSAIYLVDRKLLDMYMGNAIVSSDEERAVQAGRLCSALQLIQTQLQELG